MLKPAAAVAAALLAFPLFAADAPPAAETPKELTELIDTSIKLLEEKKYAELVERLMQPKLFAELKASGKYDKVLADFAGRKAERLLTMLKTVKPLKPELSDEDTKAAYTLPDDGKRKIGFVKEAGKWYLEGK